MIPFVMIYDLDVTFIFDSIRQCHTLRISLYNLPCVRLFTKNNKLWNESKEDFFVYMAVSKCHVTSKEIENCIFRHSYIFRHPCINSPY